MTFTIQESVSSSKSVILPSSDIRHLEQVIDYTSYTAKQSSCEWRYAFTLVTRERNFEIYMRTAEE